MRQASTAGIVAAMEERILAYIGRRGAATPEHLVKNLGSSESEVSSALEALEGRGWVSRGWARFVDSPGSEVTILTLTPTGKQELERQEALSPSSKDPVELSRDELVAEIKHRFRWSDEQIALEPTLRGSRFVYWPSVGAYAVKD